MKFRPLAMVLLTLSLAACQSASQAPSKPVAVAAASPVASAKVESGIVAFAQAACGGCHAVRPDALSPNPGSPAFAEIANEPEVTQSSLATWLRDAHNYPEDMDFDLNAAQVDALAAYILTLRDPGYKSPIS